HPAPLGLHDRSHELGTHEQGSKVDGDDPLPLRERDFLDRTGGLGYARVLEEHINATKRSITTATTRSMSSGLATSPARANPWSKPVSARVDSAAASRSTATTAAPSRAKVRAAAWPIPEPAPVTRTILPAKRIIAFPSCLRVSGIGANPRDMRERYPSLARLV